MADRKRMEECLERVEAYRSSGQKAKAWCAENGVELRMLASWVAHEKRWRARLDGVEPVSKARGFVAARVTPLVGRQEKVRLDLMGTSRAVQLDWPLAGMPELASLLRELLG